MAALIFCGKVPMGEKRKRGIRWREVAVPAVALAMALCVAGCSQADAVKAAKMIHAYVPTVTALADDASAMAEALAPDDAAVIRDWNARIQTDLQALGDASGAYAADPSGNGWARLGAAMDSLVADSDHGLLEAMAIKNPESRARAKVALSALNAAVHVLDGFLMTARTPSEVQAVAAARTVKLDQVTRYWGPRDWRTVNAAFGERGKVLAAAMSRRGL
jgi:hypothetical protein